MTGIQDVELTCTQIPNESFQRTHLHWFAMMLSITIISAAAPVASIKTYSSQTWRGLSEWIHCLLYGESVRLVAVKQLWSEECAGLLSISASLLFSARLGARGITWALQRGVHTHKGQPLKHPPTKDGSLIPILKHFSGYGWGLWMEQVSCMWPFYFVR